MARKNKSRRPPAAPRALSDSVAGDPALDPAFDAGGVQPEAGLDESAGDYAERLEGEGIAESTSHESNDLVAPALTDATHSDDGQLEAPAADGEADASVDADHSAAAAAPRAIDPGSQLGSSQTSWSQHSVDDIRGVLIQVAGGRLLLPNATIAEVLSYSEPEPVDSAPEWLLGRFRWRGWQLPLVAFSRLSGIGEDNPGLGSKVIVLKSLGGDSRAPYFAVITQGFPRLVTVSREALQIDVRDDELPPGVQAFVRLNDEPVLLPDLMQIEQRLRETSEVA